MQTTQHRNNLPIYNAIKYQKDMLSKAIDNYQIIYGIDVEVYRVVNKQENSYVTAFGASKTFSKNPGKTESIGYFKILANPSELYYQYTSGGVGEIEITTSTDKFQVGDILKYVWADGKVIEFQIVELPQTFGDAYFKYKIKGNFSTNS